MSVSNHPQTDGLTERANRTLQDVLKSLVNTDQSDWDEKLIQAEFACNNSVQASTGHTPFYLMNGQHPRMPMTSVAEYATRVPAVLDMLRELRTGLETTKVNIGKAQVRQSRVANAHRRPHAFIPGDRVWLSADNIKRPSVLSDKFASRFEGPFPITELIEDTSVRLQLPSSWHINDSFHVSMLKKYVGESDSAFAGRGVPPAPPALDAAADLWEVEICLQKRLSGKNGKQVQVLVQWLGHPQCENTWVRWDRLNDMAQAEADMLPFNELTRYQRARLTRLTVPHPPSPSQPPLPPPQHVPDQVQDNASTRRSTRVRAPRKERD